MVLLRAERAAAERTSKRECVAFAVDQQSCLVQSGDKPTVTPAMLAEWVRHAHRHLRHALAVDCRLGAW